MTKQDFLNGKAFKFKNWNNMGDCSYYYSQEGNNLNKQIHSGVDGEVLIDDFHLVVSKITDEGFEGFTMIMMKEFIINEVFSDFVLVEEKINLKA